MPAALVIPLYFLAVVALGATLAPPLYWAGHALAAQGILPFLAETDFQKYFNRAVLVAAVALLWPAVRLLRVRSARELGLHGDARWRTRLGIGLLAGMLPVAAMAGCYVAAGVYRWKDQLPWGKLPGLALSATVVSILEEALFRGAILGLFLRTLRPRAALAWTTAIFAAVHFLKPDSRVVVDHVHWGSGWALLPHTAHQFANPPLLLAGFGTLCALGWLLGWARLRTGSLFVPVGLHAGVVWVKMAFAKFTKRLDENLPWYGRELQIGLVPLGVLGLCGLLTAWLLRNEETRRKKSEGMIKLETRCG